MGHLAVRRLAVPHPAVRHLAAGNAEDGSWISTWLGTYQLPMFLHGMIQLRLIQLRLIQPQGSRDAGTPLARVRWLSSVD